MFRFVLNTSMTGGKFSMKTRSIPLTGIQSSRWFGSISEPKKFMLHYKYVPNMVEKRTPFREEHLKHANSYKAKGLLLQGGAYTDPVDGAAIIFEASSSKEVENFAENDPYYKAGLISSYQVREWNVVI